MATLTTASIEAGQIITAQQIKTLYDALINPLNYDNNPMASMLYDSVNGAVIVQTYDGQVRIGQDGDTYPDGVKVTHQGSYSQGSINNTVIGNYSHAQGFQTIASGSYSHAQGLGTTATGDHSHAQGYITTATGISSHAQGDGVDSIGGYSHAQGCDTIATGQ